jgi:peptidyl-prolyl cis-trans isomerase C
MSKRAAAATAVVIACALAWGRPAAAQVPEHEGVIPDVLATVNGVDITAEDVRLAADGLRADLEQVPQQFRLVVLLDHLVEQHLFAEKAREAGVEDSANFKDRLDYYTTKALHDSYIETVLAEEITDEEIEARYSEEIAKLPETEEIRARHVLVDTKAEANVIASMARTGDDFAELAKSYSTGPSAERGGDLGYFTADRMVSEFSDAAFALEPGAISDPIESEVGWHVIKVEDRRPKAPPSLDEVRDQMTSSILRERIRSKTEELRSTAELSILGESVPKAAEEEQSVPTGAAPEQDEPAEPAVEGGGQ